MTTVKRQLEPVPFTQVTFDDEFWAPRLEVNRTVTIPHIYRQCEETGRISAFDLSFQRPVPSPIVLIFGDSDPAKWLEAASYSLATHPDPVLAALVDSVADKIIQAQQPDGYLPSPQQFTLHLRVPDWCERWHVAVNGEPAERAGNGELSTGNGYIHLRREWNPGDVIEYRMEMPIQVMWAHPAVRDLQGRVALERGPLVYCLEGMDHAGIPLDRIAIDPRDVSKDFQVEQDENLLGGIGVLRGKGTIVDEGGWENVLYRNKQPASKNIDIMAIPYCVWENRVPGEMRVWLRAGGG